MFNICLFFALVLLSGAQDFNTNINNYIEAAEMEDILAPYDVFHDYRVDDLGYHMSSEDGFDADQGVMTSQMVTSQQPEASEYGIFDGFLDGIIKTEICKKVGPKMCAFLDPLFPCLLNHKTLLPGLKTAAAQGKLALLNYTLSPSMYEALSPCLSNCTRDVYRLAVDAKRKQRYAFETIDAMGKPPAGFLGGNVQWLGDMEECRNIYAPAPNDTDQPDLYNEFSGKYCTTRLDIHGKKESRVRIGLCLPNSCNVEDISVFVKLILKKMPTNATISEARCPSELPYTRADYIVILLCVVIGILITIGTLFDAIKRLLDTGDDDVINVKEMQAPKNETINTICGPSMTSDPNAILVQHDSVEMQEDALDAHVRHVHNRLNGTATNSEARPWEKLKQKARGGKACCNFKGILSDLLMAFSLLENGKRLFNTTISGRASAVDGIRVLTAGWVILGHSVVSIVIYLANPIQFVKEIKTFWWQPIVNTALAADSFFVLGGFLVAYLTLKKLKKGPFLGVNWFSFYLHRYWRLTPTYMFVLLFWSTLFVHLPSGPLTDTVQNNPRLANCSKYWWTNLLYIHNFIPGNPSEACMGWTWFLADDMQFFILSPLFIIGLYKLWKVFVPFMCVLISACVISTGLVARYLEKDWVNPMVHMGQIFQGGVFNQDWSRMFVRPYHRIAPYLVGMIAAYIVFRVGSKDVSKAKLWKKVLLVIFWLVIFCLCGMCVYGLTGHYEFHGHFPINMSATYLSGSRILFTTCLALALVACNLGAGGPVTWFLSYSGFRPLARLSFIVFLIHPLVIQATYKSIHITYYFNDTTLAYVFIGHIVLCYLSAFVIHLAIEAPCVALERIIRKYVTETSRSRDQEIRCCC